MVGSRLRAEGYVGQVGAFFDLNRASQLVSVGSAGQTRSLSGASPPPVAERLIAVSPFRGYAPLEATSRAVV
jgi:hypothetical protein